VQDCYKIGKFDTNRNPSIISLPALNKNLLNTRTK